MLMNAGLSATTVAILGGSLPDWFTDFVTLAFAFGSIFSLPFIIKTIYNAVFGNSSKGE